MVLIMEEPPLREQQRGSSRRTRRVPPPILPPKRFEDRSWILEFTLRAGLFCLFFITESMEPFYRVIQPEEMWLYRYPIPEMSYFEEIGGRYLKIMLDPFSMISYGIFVIIGKLILGHYNPLEARQAAYAFFLAVPFTGVTVNILKNVAGRPRPDFLARCYGTYYYLRYKDMSHACLNDGVYVQDGRKSFPSGHSALAACCFGFLAIYFAGQFGSFNERARYKITSVVVTIPLLVLPILIAISRTCDYKHHWQDVSVGLIIGFLITYMSYRVYFPSLTDPNSHLPFICIPFPIEKIRAPPHAWEDSSSEDETDYSRDGIDNNDNSVPRQVCLDRPYIVS